MSRSKKSEMSVDERRAESEAGIDRRGFLKISSAAAAVAVAAPTLAKTEKDRKQYPTAPKSSVKDLKGGWFVV